MVADLLINEESTAANLNILAAENTLQGQAAHRKCVNFAITHILVLDAVKQTEICHSAQCYGLYLRKN